MKPIGTKKALVLVNLAQKEESDVRLGDSGIILKVNHNYGFDGKVANPNLAYIVSPGASKDLEEGDAVLCHHNSFSRVMNQDTPREYLYGDTGLRVDGKALFRLELDMIDLKLKEEEGEIKPYPLTGFLLVERIPKVYKTTLIIPDSAKKNEENFFKVLEVGKECEGINKGDIIMCFKHSDYEIPFNYKQQDRVAIRVRYTDVLGVKQIPEFYTLERTVKDVLSDMIF